jgi:hypothetical protein
MQQDIYHYWLARRASYSDAYTSRAEVVAPPMAAELPALELVRHVHDDGVQGMPGSTAIDRAAQIKGVEIKFGGILCFR